MNDIKTKIINLVDAFKDYPDDLEFIEIALYGFVKYVNAVVMMEYQMHRIRATLEGEELRDSIQKLDDNRRTAHEGAIRSCKWLNNLSAEKGLEPFYPGDLSDRYAVADFVGDTIRELYETGIDYTREKSIDMFAKDFKIFSKLPIDQIIEKCKVKNQDSKNNRKCNIDHEW